MNILNIAEELNSRAENYKMGKFQEKRKEINSLKNKTKEKIFNLKNNKNNSWLIHHGGRKELQFHIKIEDNNMLRYGLAFAIESSQFIFPEKILFLITPQINIFNELISSKPDLFYNKDNSPKYEMFCVDKKHKKEYLQFNKISSSIINVGNFVFFGKTMSLSEINYDEILQTFDKMLPIYEYVLTNYKNNYVDKDDREQDELVYILKDKPKKELLKELFNDTGDSNEKIPLKGSGYKRNNTNIAKIKILRGFDCQICGKSILKRDGSKYIEAAHIKDKPNGGKELWNNIILLCPNHHKEFDYGKREIILHNEKLIKFKIGEEEFIISFEIDCERNGI